MKSLNVVGGRGRHSEPPLAPHVLVQPSPRPPPPPLPCWTGVDAFLVEIFRRHLSGLHKFTTVDFGVGYVKRSIFEDEDSSSDTEDG